MIWTLGRVAFVTAIPNGDPNKCCMSEHWLYYNSVSPINHCFIFNQIKCVNLIPAAWNNNKKSQSLSEYNSF